MLQGLMQNDFPLTLQHFLWRSTTLFPTKEIVTRRETGRHRYTYAEFGRRVAQLAHALKELGAELLVSPITPRRVLEAIAAAKTKHAERAGVAA